MKKSNNKKFDVALMILGSISALYFFVLIFFASFNLFLLIYPVFSILTIGYALFEIKYEKSFLAYFSKWIQILVILFVIFVVTVFVIFEGLFIYQSLHSYNHASDYTLVLGAQVQGTSLSPSLQYRLDTAISYYEQFPTTTLVVSGGQGSGEGDSEANIMKQYLIKNGIPEKKIIAENKSTTTYENLIFSKKILDTLNTDDYSVTIITNTFHCYRALYIANEIGLNAHTYAAPGHMISTPHFYIREFFAMLKEIVVFS